MKIKLITIASCICLIVITDSCDPNKNRKKVKLEGIEHDLKVYRFEQDLLNIDTAEIYKGLQDLSSTYDSFFLNTYFERILNIRNPYKSAANAEWAKVFITSPPILALHDSVKERFADIEEIETGLEQGFRHVKYYFPNLPLPGRLITLISEFGIGAATIEDNTIAVGLDLYLGSGFSFYKMFEQYRVHRFNRERIVSDCMSAYYENHFSEVNAQSAPLIYEMINSGKKVLFLEHTLPEEDLYKLLGYTKEQADWCEVNEDMIWKFMVENELLFATDKITKRRFIGAGPSTSGMPKESPGDIGSFIGYRIIKSYIKRKNTELNKILGEDPEEIYKNSKYKPFRS